MHGITLLLVAAIGVDVGWKPDENGDLEYIIQIAPEQLQSLKPGDAIEVGVRPMLRPVRRYRIVVGTDPLPRETARPAIENAPADPMRSPIVAGDAAGSRAAAGLLTLPAPPQSPLALQPSLGEAKPVDHSVMVQSEEGPSNQEDPRWVAANGEHQAIQLQPIPTEQILPSPQPPATAVSPLNALPPPPETPVASPTNSGTVEMPALPGAGDPFVPDYRKQESASEDAAQPERYRFGDSVPVDQGSIQASGVVPPTPRLILPPPPRTEDSFPATSTTPAAPLQLPPPPEQAPASDEPPGVLKTAAARPRVQSDASAEGDHKTDTAPRSDTPGATTGEGVGTPTAATRDSSWGVWLALALFASLGGNLFLGYVAWDIRKRFLTAFRGQQTVDRNSGEMIAEAEDRCTEMEN